MGDLATYANAWVSTWDLQLVGAMLSGLLLAFVAAPAHPERPVARTEPVCVRAERMTLDEQWQRLCGIGERASDQAQRIAVWQSTARDELDSAELTLAAMRKELAGIMQIAVPRAIVPGEAARPRAVLHEAALAA